ncbi:MAG: hypothetical protein WDN04_28375 [Rhodospirillales bacterium]
MQLGVAGECGVGDQAGLRTAEIELQRDVAQRAAAPGGGLRPHVEMHRYRQAWAGQAGDPAAERELTEFRGGIEPRRRQHAQGDARLARRVGQHQLQVWRL